MKLIFEICLIILVSLFITENILTGQSIRINSDKAIDKKEIKLLPMAPCETYEQPMPVYSYVKQIESYDWYVTQARLWRNVLQNNPENANAWLYYYTATRMAKMTDPEQYNKAINNNMKIIESLNFNLNKIKSRNLNDSNNINWFGQRDSVGNTTWFNNKFDSTGLINQNLDWRKWLDSNGYFKNNYDWNKYLDSNGYFKGGFDLDQLLKANEFYLQNLDSIIVDINKFIPDTYEDYYIKTYNSRKFDKEYYDLINKAFRLAPNRPEIYDEMLSYYEVHCDKENMKTICRKWYESGDLSEGILAWNYNVLVSLDSNAVIITNGDNDTYPMWVLQNAKNIQPQVKVINIYLATIDDYRKELFKELGLPDLNIDREKLKNNTNINIALGEIIIKHIKDNLKNRPLYLALTLNWNYYESFKDSLYLIGTAFEYCDKEFDNMAVLKRNYEKNFLLDNLKIDLKYDISTSVVNQINMNYLPVFIKLYQHYKLSGDITKAGEVIKLGINVGERAGLKNVNLYFE